MNTIIGGNGENEGSSDGDENDSEDGEGSSDGDENDSEDEEGCSKKGGLRGLVKSMISP